MRWIHIHIPKCAGTTFTAILKANFEGGFGDGRSYLSDRNFKYSSEQVSQILNQFPRLTCFSDHKLSIQIPWEEFPVCSIAFIRDPADRLISHYQYCKSQAERGIVFDQEAASLDLEQYIEETLDKKPKADLKDGQCYHLFGQPAPNDFSIVSELLRQQRLLLFPLKSFKDACVFLEKSYSQDFSDTSYISLNSSKHQLNISDDIRQDIRDRMFYDTGLYEMAQSWFAEALSSAFINETELNVHRQDLDRRCDQLQKSQDSLMRRFRESVLKRLQVCDRAAYFT